MDWINKHAVSSNWESGPWILQDKKKSRAKFDPTTISIPISSVQTLNGVAKVPIDELPFPKGGMHCFLQNKGLESWVIHGTDYLESVDVAGSCEEVPVPLPKIEATTEAARISSQCIIGQYNDLVQPVCKALLKGRVLQHLIVTGDACLVSQPIKKHVTINNG